MTTMMEKDLNPRLCEVIDEPHCICSLQEVGAVTEANHAIKVITFEMEQAYSFGYLETKDGVLD